MEHVVEGQTKEKGQSHSSSRSQSHGEKFETGEFFADFVAAIKVSIPTSKCKSEAD